MDFTQEVMARMCEGLSGERAALIRAVIEENLDLRTNLDKITKLHTKATEDFEQERYSLKNKMEMMSNLEHHYTEEVANLQEQLQTLQSDTSDSKQQEAEVSKLKLKVEGLVSQLESSHASEKELQHKLEVREKQFAEYREEHENLNEQKSLMASEDYLLLQTQVTSLQENVEELTEQLAESKEHLKILLTEKEVLKSELLAREEDNEQMRAEISSYTNALEKSREEVVEYKVLLENMQMEKASHGEKGNSLFGELDDRRVTAEKMLVTTKSQCEVAKQQLAKERQQHHRLKVQLATMLQANNDNLGGEGFTRMETTLSQLRSEKEALKNKLQQYETIQKEQMEKLLELQNKAGAGDKGEPGEDSHTQFLIAVLQAKEEEIANMKKELDQQNFKMLCKNDKIIDGNRQIFKLETDLEKAHKKSMRLALEIEELRLKYEPEQGKKTVKQGKTEKIPLISEQDESAKFVLKENVLPNSKQDTDTIFKSDSLSDTVGHDISVSTCSSSILSETMQAGSSLLTGKQVKIREQVEMISEEGHKESSAIREESKTGKENIMSQKKPRKCVVHHNVKKVSASNTAAVDANQCKQQ